MHTVSKLFGASYGASLLALPEGGNLRSSYRQTSFSISGPSLLSPNMLFPFLERFTNPLQRFINVCISHFSCRGTLDYLESSEICIADCQFFVWCNAFYSSCARERFQSDLNGIISATKFPVHWYNNGSFFGGTTVTTDSPVLSCSPPPTNVATPKRLELILWREVPEVCFPQRTFSSALCDSASSQKRRFPTQRGNPCIEAGLCTHFNLAG